MNDLLNDGSPLAGPIFAIHPKYGRVTVIDITKGFSAHNVAGDATIQPDSIFVITIIVPLSSLKSNDERLTKLQAE